MRPLLLATLAGISIHILYFHRYEYHRRLYTIIAVGIWLSLAIPIVIFWQSEVSWLTAFGHGFLLELCFLVGAVGSTLAYRLFLNPLNQFPGPFWARVTNFWIAFHVGKELNQYHKLEALHSKYGPIVRTGADSLSIVAPEFVDATLNQRSVATKGPFYDLDYPHKNLHHERNRAVHDRQRSLWAPAFSDRALKEYENEVKVYNKKFLDRVAQLQGTPMDVTKWFGLYSFDVMGVLSFGKNYGMLDSGEKHKILGVLSDGMSILGLTFPTWFIRVLKLIPGDSSGMKKFHAFTDSELTDAVHNNFHGQKGTDLKFCPGSVISSWLYRIYEKDPDPANNGSFQADARLIIVAGSGTTATAFTFLFYLLATHPEEVEKIRSELRLSAQGDWSDSNINQLGHLNGAINEALRLYPPGPSGVFRTTPPEGMRVGQTFIPGNVTVQIPPYIVSRGE